VVPRVLRADGRAQDGEGAIEAVLSLVDPTGCRIELAQVAADASHALQTALPTLADSLERFEVQSLAPLAGAAPAQGRREVAHGELGLRLVCVVCPCVESERPLIEERGAFGTSQSELGLRQVVERSRVGQMLDRGEGGAIVGFRLLGARREVHGPAAIEGLSPRAFRILGRRSAGRCAGEREEQKKPSRGERRLAAATHALGPRTSRRYICASLRAGSAATTRCHSAIACSPRPRLQ